VMTCFDRLYRVAVNRRNENFEKLFHARTKAWLPS
jgi:hypothetical protein